MTNHSPLASVRAVREALDRYGLSTKKSFGQHFLIDDNVVGRIVGLADPHPDDVVFEVGPGLGTLTLALLPHVRAVLAVEKDRALFEVLDDLKRDHPNRFHYLPADAVTVTPEEVAAPFGAPTALISNLPYAVAATIVLRTFDEFPSIRSMTVMVQSEVADRFAANRGTKDYGSYSVKLALRARVTGRFQVSRQSFFPPPRVDSAVVRLDRVEEIAGEATLRNAARLADAAFAQRRKTIRNSMLSSLPDVEPGLLDAAFAHVGIDPRVRGEALEPYAFVQLAAFIGCVR